MIIDIKNRRIKADLSDRSMSVLQFHRRLMTIFDDPEYMTEPSPTVRVSDDQIMMVNGWEVNLHMLAILYGGTLQQDDSRVDFEKEPDKLIFDSPRMRMIRE